MRLPRASYQDCAPVALAIAQLLIFILCCCLVACAELPQHFGTTVREWEQNSAMTLPRPGENLIIHPNFIRESDSCYRKKLPLMLIEKSELMPTKVDPFV